MALNNYANLKIAIANFLARDDLTSEIDDFIDLTEADFNRRLRIRSMETVDSSFTIDAETEALPTGFLQVRSFVLTSPTPDRALQVMTPFHQANTQGFNNSGTPRVYSIEGSNFRFSPVPDTAATARLTFYKAFDNLRVQLLLIIFLQIILMFTYMVHYILHLHLLEVWIRELLYNLKHNMNLL